MCWLLDRDDVHGGISTYLWICIHPPVFWSLVLQREEDIDLIMTTATTTVDKRTFQKCWFQQDGIRRVSSHEGKCPSNTCILSTNTHRNEYQTSQSSTLQYGVGQLLQRLGSISCALNTMSWQQSSKPVCPMWEVYPPRGVREVCFSTSTCCRPPAGILL